MKKAMVGMLFAGLAVVGILSGVVLAAVVKGEKCRAPDADAFSLIGLPRVPMVPAVRDVGAAGSRRSGDYYEFGPAVRMFRAEAR